MAVLNLLSAIQMNIPGGPWETVILKWFSFVPHYAWRIVVFTIFLKLILSPLDIYQRIAMRKNQKITERIAPEMEKLKAQYANDKQALSQKQMELNRREGFSYLSSCLPMIVTLVVFFWLFSGLNSISQYMSMKQYVDMYNRYTEVKTEFFIDNGLNENGKIDIETKSGAKITIDGKEVLISSLTSADIDKDEVALYQNKIAALATDKAQDKVKELYESELKVGFLWIKNVWSPDVPWVKSIPVKSKFESNIGKYASNPELYTGLPDKASLDAIVSEYDTVTLKLQSDTSINGANGFLVLPILSVGLSFLSQFLMQRQQKKSGQAQQQSQGTMKMMMMIMPVMMGVFALSYTSVFTLYIITNSFMTLLINLSTTGIIMLLNKNGNKGMQAVNIKTAKPGADGIIRYGRPDPNAVNNGGPDARAGAKKSKTEKK